MAQINIGGTFHSTATGNVVANANEILDVSKNKKQSEVNAEHENKIDELEQAVGAGGSVDTRIENALKSLDSTASHEVGTDGLSISVTQTDGKITEITGSIASETYDEYGAAESAKEDLIDGASSGYDTFKNVEDRVGELSEDVPHIGQSEGSVTVPEFDAASQSLHITPQTLSNAQKVQARTNIGMQDIPTRVSTLEEHETISLGGGDIGVGSAADFTNRTVVGDAKVPTIGAVLEGADTTPTANSDRLVTSGGVAAKLSQLGQQVEDIEDTMQAVVVDEELLSNVSYTQTAWQAYHSLGTTLIKGRSYRLELRLTGFPLSKFGNLILTSDGSSSAPSKLDVTSLFGTKEQIVSGQWRKTIFVDTTSLDNYPYRYLQIRGASSAYQPNGQVEIKVYEETNKASFNFKFEEDIIAKQYNSPEPQPLGYYVVGGVNYDIYAKARQEETAIGSSYGLWVLSDNGVRTQIVTITTAQITAGININVTIPITGQLCLYQQQGTFTVPNIADVNISAILNLEQYNEYLQITSLNKKKYNTKGCLYIGDSISTSNNYFWKGYIEKMCGLGYARNISSSVGHATDTDDANMWPADGGITIIPPVNEPSTIANKSIWYRCAENRLASYLRFADFISLFGGANDLSIEGLQLGSVHDTPYVDDVTTFPAEKQAELTDVRPAELTFASAYMGCIEMLHRDLPNAKILLPTVFPFLNTGNDVDAEGVSLSERMAILQLQIASKYNGEETPPSKQKYPSCDYGVLAIPFYWDMRTKVNSVVGAFAKDGVHPNTIQARRMAQVFIDTLETI